MTRIRSIILANLFVVALAIIIILVAWNVSGQSQSLAFNLATELLGAVLIFILLNLLFPISDEKFILERIASLLNRLESRSAIFLNRDTAHEQFNFKEILRQAKDLDILAYSSSNLIESCWSEITNAVRTNGTRVRILILNPQSDASKLIHSHSTGRAFEGDMLKTLPRFKSFEKELANLQKNRKTGSLEIKYTTWIPSCSLIIFNRKEHNGILKVKVYPIYYSTPGGSTITAHQVVTKESDKTWFDYFANQFDRLWQNPEGPEPNKDQNPYENQPT